MKRETYDLSKNIADTIVSELSKIVEQPINIMDKRYHYFEY
jgi:sugar diacid utilization regulator